MKFEKIKIEFEKYCSVDVIASSFEEPTEKPIEPTIKHDPYENDKW